MKQLESRRSTTGNIVCASRKHERGLLNAVRTAVALDAEGSLPAAPVPDYADENVSTKVVKIIQSYTGIVDRMVWRSTD